MAGRTSRGRLVRRYGTAIAAVLGYGLLAVASMAFMEGVGLVRLAE